MSRSRYSLLQNMQEGQEIEELCPNLDIKVKFFTSGHVTLYFPNAQKTLHMRIKVNSYLKSMSKSAHNCLINFENGLQERRFSESISKSGHKSSKLIG